MRTAPDSPGSGPAVERAGLELGGRPAPLPRPDLGRPPGLRRCRPRASRTIRRRLSSDPTARSASVRDSPGESSGKRAPASRRLPARAAPGLLDQQRKELEAERVGLKGETSGGVRWEGPGAPGVARSGLVGGREHALGHVLAEALGGAPAATHGELLGGRSCGPSRTVRLAWWGLHLRSPSSKTPPWPPRAHDARLRLGVGVDQHVAAAERRRPRRACRCRRRSPGTSRPGGWRPGPCGGRCPRASAWGSRSSRARWSARSCATRRRSGSLPLAAFSAVTSPGAM